jgi:hypothetical protein
MIESACLPKEKDMSLKGKGSLAVARAYTGHHIKIHPFYIAGRTQ